MIGYSAANICLRRLADLGCDPGWAICVKEMVSVIVVGLWLLVKARRGQAVLPSGRPLVLLVLVGLATELIGNTGLQWGYGVAGLSVMIPVVFAFLLTGCAALGWFLLGERVSLQSMAAIGLLLLALPLLGQGAEDVSQSIVIPGRAPAGAVAVVLAIGLAGVAGIIYSLLSIVIRHCVTGTTRLSSVVLIITGMGVITLGPLSLVRLGPAHLLGTPGSHLAWMIAAGVCNLIAFLALTRGLQLTTVVHVNMLNATQVALAAVAGIVLFHETPTRWLMLGVALTIAGILLIGRPTDQQAVDQHV